MIREYRPTTATGSTLVGGSSALSDNPVMSSSTDATYDATYAEIDAARTATATFDSLPETSVAGFRLWFASTIISETADSAQALFTLKNASGVTLFSDTYQMTDYVRELNAFSWSYSPDLADYQDQPLTLYITDATPDSGAVYRVLEVWLLVDGDIAAPGCSRVLLPGAVTPSPYLPEAKWQPTIVGDPPQWADDDDATYALLEQEGTSTIVKQSHAHAALPATPYLDKIDPTTATVTFGFRYSGTTTGAGLTLEPELLLGGSTHVALFPYWSLTADGGVYEITAAPAPSTLSYYGVTVADLVGHLAAGDLTLAVRVGYGDTYQTRALYIYKAWVSVAFQCLPSHTPWLRQYPRSPLRQWPPERSYQRSNRRAGGYL